MPPIDYSKWDKLVDSGSESEPQYDRSIQSTPEPVTFEPSGRRPGPPVVTRFTQPQTVRLESHSSIESQPRTLCTQEPQPEGAAKKQSLGGAVLHDGELAWDQTSTSVDIYIRLPSAEDTTSRRKDERQVTLIATEPPEELREGRSIPAAFTAADPGTVCAEGESGADAEANLFPVAWGLRVQWPVHKSASKDSAIWSRANDNTVVKMEGYFPFPVTNIEEAWSWEIVTGCPFVESHDKRYMHVEVVKKQSMALAGVSIWWDRLFFGQSPIDTGKRPGAEKRAAFAQVWQEAHEAFKEKMRQKKETDDRIVVTSDGRLLHPNYAITEEDTARVESS